MRILYATDASVYRELPLAVAMPKSTEDIKQLIHFARTEKKLFDSPYGRDVFGGAVCGNGDSGRLLEIF